jgi:hypothetical protein
MNAMTNGDDAVVVRLDERETWALNGALNWIVNGVDAEDPRRWEAFGVTRDQAREVFRRQRAVERGADGGKTLALSPPDARWVAEAVRAVLPGGRHAFPRGDTHPLTGVGEDEVTALSARLDALAATGG